MFLEKKMEVVRGDTYERNMKTRNKNYHEGERKRGGIERGKRSLQTKRSAMTLYRMGSVGSGSILKKSPKIFI